MASRRPRLLPEVAVPVHEAADAEASAIHVVPADGGWAVRVEGTIEVAFDDQSEAVEAAWKLARKRSARVFVHARRGTYELRMTEADELLWELWKGIRAREQTSPSTA
jgi:Uncharacterized protein conserved in bacteria (DUF2188)